MPLRHQVFTAHIVCGIGGALVITRVHTSRSGAVLSGHFWVSPLLFSSELLPHEEKHLTLKICPSFLPLGRGPTREFGGLKTPLLVFRPSSHVVLDYEFGRTTLLLMGIGA